MINSEPDRWHRIQRGRNALGATLGLLVLAASIIPTNVRAVFLNDDSRAPAKAFAARTSPAGASPNDFVPASTAAAPISSTTAASSPDATLRATTSDPFPGSPLSSTPPTAPLFPAASDEKGETSSGSELLSQAPVNRPMFAQNLGLFSPGLAGSPPSGSIIPTDPALPTDPMSAVPEPESWAMLLLGFFAIGGIMRRERRTVANA